MPATSVVSMGKKTKGRKRQIATDTLGCLLGVVVNRANLDDTTMVTAALSSYFCEYKIGKELVSGAHFRLAE